MNNQPRLGGCVSIYYEFRYGVHLVVANILHTRYKEILLVSPEGQQLVTLADGKRELEASFVPAVAEAHYGFIGDSDRPYGLIPSQPETSKGRQWWVALGRDQLLGHVAMALVVAPALGVLVNLLQKRFVDRLLRESK